MFGDKFGLKASMIAAVIIAAVGCGKDDDAPQYKDEIIRFTVAKESAIEIESRAGESVSEPLKLTSEDGSQSLTFLRTVSRTQDSGLFQSDMLTKGTPVTGSNIDALYGDELYVTALKSDGSIYVPKQKLIFSSREEGKSESTWTTAKPYYWPGENLVFWSWAPNSLMENLSASKTSLSFSYTTPDSNGVSKDAEAQSDLIVASTTANLKSGTASLLFAHALSAIRFEMGNTMSLKIKSISLKDVLSQGTCTFIPDSSKEHAYEQIVWTNISEEKTYTQNFNQAVVDGTEKAPQAIGPQEATFMVIPQCATGGNKISLDVTIEVNGEEKHCTATLENQDWKAGITYTYMMDYDGYDYEFHLTNAEQGNLVYTNTTEPSAMTVVPITSNKTTSSATYDAEWDIASYTIDGVTTEVTDNQFTGGGLTVAKNGKNINVTALAREVQSVGSHDYWINSNGRAEDLDWSPVDWSSVSETSPIDLSKMDYTKDDYSSAVGAFSMTTANCYIIRHAGTYKLPLVYGNAVVNGNDNEQSYYPNVTGGEYRLSRFVNHNGNGITSAFIENNTGCTAASCSIVWQDEAAVIKNLSIIGNTLAAGNYTKDNVRYLQFTIDDATICQNNSVIAVKDGSGNIMWSWHIWTTNDPALLTPAIPVTNKAGIIYNFFPLGGLGYVEPTDYPSKDQVIITLKQSLSGNIVNITVDQPMVLGLAKSNYYQYGRKDPMCRKDSPQFGVFKRDGIGKVNLQTAIMNPNTFYRYDSDLINWCSATYYNLWTGKKSIGGEMEDDAEIIKTVYDPSPVGYKMPASNAFTGFTTTGKESSMISQFNVSGSYNTGWNFYTNSSHNSTIFFPALGYREISGGEVKNAGSKAYYWTAITVFEGDGYHLRFASDIVCPLDTGYGRVAGFTIRPVLE